MLRLYPEKCLNSFIITLYVCVIFKVFYYRLLSFVKCNLISFPVWISRNLSEEEICFIISFPLDNDLFSLQKVLFSRIYVALAG